MGTATLTLTAHDVTETQELVLDGVQRDLPAGALAETLARRMALPDDVPWALRDNVTSRVLDEKLPIGDQLSPAGSLTVFPRTHLG